MRTDAQEQAFAKECLKIENAGGDVLAYIAKEYPSYTPRPVWYRLQRNYLKRKTDQLTEGRPKIPERKEVDEVRKETRNSQEDTVRALIDAHKAGKSIRECLQELGYTNVASALRNAKGWARKNRPEMAKELERIGLGRPPVKPEEPGKKPVDDQTGEHHAEAEKAPETVTLGGKTYELFVRDEKPDGTVTDRKITTCCAPAPPSGVTVPDDLPEEPDGYQRVAAVAREMLEEIKTAKDAKPIYPIGKEEMVFCVKKMDSKLGVWEYNREKDLYIFQANFYDERQLNVLALTIKDWLNLAAEIPKAIRKLTEIME